jgi:hypothetical protein
MPWSVPPLLHERRRARWWRQQLLVSLPLPGLLHIARQRNRHGRLRAGLRTPQQQLSDSAAVDPLQAYP